MLLSLLSGCACEVALFCSCAELLLSLLSGCACEVALCLKRLFGSIDSVLDSLGLTTGLIKLVLQSPSVVLCLFGFYLQICMLLAGSVHRLLCGILSGLELFRKQYLLGFSVVSLCRNVA